MKRREALKVFARVLEVLSIVAGLSIVAACTTAGFASNRVLGGLAGFAVAGVIAAIFVGVVFILTTMSTDVMELRSKADAETKSIRDPERP